eukprot:TRINITY_DN5768_c0_g1_i1.p1 TRINITY_DN5768_c0_g1~~TRINITY_DN5768_c0_g1_i1.p1  ORF type:complete len:354 (-),score=153.57 TRINITY_DN5768_c0_g1_i1:53-1114(-)
MDDAGLGRSGLDRERMGVSVASGIGSIDEVYDASTLLHGQGHRKISPYFIPRMLVNLAAGHVSIEFDLRGPNHATATACAASAHAIGEAVRTIQYGDADIMVAGGAEAAVHPLAVAGFTRCRALSTKYNDEPSKASRPFDADRDGFVIGEGAGILVLEELEHALARGAPIYGEVLGYGSSGDAFHITQPSSDGRGALACMRAALRDAQLSPRDLDLVNCHATSTPTGDVLECRALDQLVRDESKTREDGDGKSASVLVTSTKGALGHALGAAGAIEAVLSLESLRTGIVPPTLNVDSLDSAIVDEMPSIRVVANKAMHCGDDGGVSVVMSNSFGFGGTNASLVFGKVSSTELD